MVSTELAYRLVTLFDQKVTAPYYSSFKGEYGRIQIDTLSWLYEHPGIRAMDLVERTDASKQHISKVLARFESEGLIERIPDPGDRRAELLRLTEAGRSYVEAHKSVSDQNFLELMEFLTDEEAASMNEAMQLIIDMLERA